MSLVSAFTAHLNICSLHVQLACVCPVTLPVLLSLLCRSVLPCIEGYNTKTTLHMCRQCMGVVHTIYVQFVSSFIYIHCNTFIPDHIHALCSTVLTVLYMHCCTIGTISMYACKTAHCLCTSCTLYSCRYTVYCTKQSSIAFSITCTGTHDGTNGACLH